MAKKKAKTDKRIWICLYDLANPVIIVPEKTGIVYYNQVGGCACHQRNMEGYLIPAPKQVTIDDYFFSNKWWYEVYGRWAHDLHSEMILDKNGKYGSDFTQWIYWESVSKHIENFLNSGCDIFRMRKAKIDKKAPQLEAWIKVSIEIQNEFGGKQYEILGDKNNKWERKDCILTWRNSD